MATNMYQDTGPLLTELDTNLVACALVHLQPADLAQVALTCRGLQRESESDVVWCTLFLRRFSSDFWGEAAPGPHPYTSVPQERNEWLEHSRTDLFARFSLSCRRDSERAAAAGAEEDEEDDEAEGVDHIYGLTEFVRLHATSPGYGGWKQAYHRMHDMVTLWRRPANTAYIVAGLPAFSTLSAITDIIKHEVSRGFAYGKFWEAPPDATTRLEADLVSPGGQCRVIRMRFISPDLWEKPVERIANVCVIRKPRNWYQAGASPFRGLELEGQQLVPLGTRDLQWFPGTPKLIYVVDGARMERSQDYPEIVYRELHGVLGEGKDRFEFGLAVALYLLNTLSRESILKRLKIPTLTEPLHMCPYYAGPVYFVVANIDIKHDDHESVETALYRQSKVASSFVWLSQQPSSRVHWNVGEGLALCALTAES